MKSEKEIREEFESIKNIMDHDYIVSASVLWWVLDVDGGATIQGDGWRDFAKEKPDEDGYYLVYEEAGFNRYKIAKWCFMWSGNTYPVKAWRPLPDAPSFNEN